MQICLEDFKRFRELSKGMDTLNKQIMRLEKADRKPITDKVSGSLKHFPYTEKHYRVIGLICNTARIESKKDQLQEMAEEREAILDKIKSFMVTIPKEQEEIRDALELYYIDGLTYPEVAYKMGLEGDGVWPMRKAHEYVKGYADIVREVRK